MDDYLDALNKAAEHAPDDDARSAVNKLIDQATGPHAQSGGGSAPPTPPIKQN